MCRKHPTGQQKLNCRQNFSRWTAEKPILRTTIILQLTRDEQLPVSAVHDAVSLGKTTPIADACVIVTVTVVVDRCRFDISVPVTSYLVEGPIYTSIICNRPKR